MTITIEMLIMLQKYGWYYDIHRQMFTAPDGTELPRNRIEDAGSIGSTLRGLERIAERHSNERPRNPRRI